MCFLPNVVRGRMRGYKPPSRPDKKIYTQEASRCPALYVGCAVHTI